MAKHQRSKRGKRLRANKRKRDARKAALNAPKLAVKPMPDSSAATASSSMTTKANADSTGWRSLPPLILEDILNKLKTQQDCLEFELVCASWHQVSMTEKQRLRLNTLPQVPMLLVPGQENHSHSLYNVVTERFSESKLLVPYEGRFASFSRGWLVALEKDLSVTLYKAYPNKDDTSAPITIRLPIIARNKKKYVVQKAVISADPVTNPNECVVMIIFGRRRELAFIRPNKDTQWTRSVSGSVPGLYGFGDIIYRNDQFYAVTSLGVLFSFNVTSNAINYFQDMKKVIRHHQDAYPGNLYLAESQGELLLIRRGLKVRRRKRKLSTRSTCTRRTCNVFVYKLNVEKKKWVMISNLSDVAVFLGDNSSISISCLDFPGCKPNSVYFTHDFDGLPTTRFRVDDFGEYDLESDGMTPHFGMDNITASNIFPRVPIWFVPNAQ